jgi:hypothetical protein
MRNIQLVLFTAIAVLGLAVDAIAAPAITPLGNYNLLPNTPGQKIPLYVSGIVPSDGPNFPLVVGGVDGIVLSVAINGGGVAFGGAAGPIITSVDFDSGPTIWVAPNSPAGHYPAQSAVSPPPSQLVDVGFLTISGWVNVTGGLLATLIVDTTGFNSGTYPLTLSGGVIAAELGDTIILGWSGNDGVVASYLGPAGQITIVPEPSSVVLAAIGLIGLAAWGWRRKRGS